MSDEMERDRRVREALARGRTLVREARQLVDQTRRRFAELGVDPEAELERLKAAGGEEAVLQAQAEFQGLLDSIDAEMRRDALHAQHAGATQLRPRFNRV